jgi:hypothetical protein
MADTHIRQYREGQRHVNLTKTERSALAEQRQMESIVVMFLDLEQDRTWKQIAEENGISISELKRITRKPEFQRIYDEATVAIGHDPRLQAVTTQLPDLLPVAFRKLKELLTKPEVRDDVRLKAILEIMKMNQVGKDGGTEDPGEMSNFLKKHNVEVQGDMIINMGMPEDFQAAFRKFTGTDAVDAVVRNLDTEAPLLTASEATDPASPPETPAAQ